MAQPQANHRGVIHIGIELVIELEVPAARLALRILDLPVAGLAHLLLQNPVGAFHHPRIVRRNSRFAQGKQRIRRIPHRRHAGLHAESVFLFDAQLFELVERADHLRIVHRIPQAAQRDDRIHHRGINRSQAVAHLEALQHPLLRLLQRHRAQRTDVHALEPVRNAIEHQEEIPPRNQLLRPVQMHARFVAPADERALPLPFRRESS